MGEILKSLPKTIHLSIALSLIVFIGLFFGNGGFDFDTLFGAGYLDIFMFFQE